MKIVRKKSTGEIFLAYTDPVTPGYQFKGPYKDVKAAKDALKRYAKKDAMESVGLVRCVVNGKEFWE